MVTDQSSLKPQRRGIGSYPWRFGGKNGQPSLVVEVKTLRQTPGNGDGNGNVPISDEMTQKLHNSAYQLVKTCERLRSLASRLSSLD